MTYRVTYDRDDGEWKVEKDALLGYNTVRTFDNKKDAVKKGKQYAKAKDDELYIYKKKRTTRTNYQDYIDYS